MISELVTRGSVGGGQQETFYMHVPANKTGLVIGKGGDTIKQVNSTSLVCLFGFFRFAVKLVHMLSYRVKIRLIQMRKCSS